MYTDVNIAKLFITDHNYVNIVLLLKVRNCKTWNNKLCVRPVYNTRRTINVELGITLLYCMIQRFL